MITYIYTYIEARTHARARAHTHKHTIRCHGLCVSIKSLWSLCSATQENGTCKCVSISTI